MGFFRKYYISFIQFILATAVLCFITFPMSSWDNINYDSTYQFFLTKHSMKEIWELLPLDYSPPFYAVALKLYSIVFGDSLLVLRSFSLFSFVFTFYLSAFPVRKEFGNKSSIICTILLCGSSVNLIILNEIRPTVYSISLVMAMMFYAYTAYFHESRAELLKFTVFSVLSMYTHNVAMISVFAVYVFIIICTLIKRNFKKFRAFLISGLVSALLYLPWLGVILNQIKNVGDHFWKAENVTLSKIVSWVFEIEFSDFNNNILSDVIFIVIKFYIFFVLVKSVNRNKLKKLKTLREMGSIFDFEQLNLINKNRMGKVFFIGMEISLPVFVFMMIHIFFSPLASERYFYMFSGMYIVALAAVIPRIKPKSICWCLVALFTVNSVAASYNFGKNISDKQKEKNIREMTDDVEKLTDNPVFLHSHEWSLGIASYYFPEAEHLVYDGTFTVLKSFDVFGTKITSIGKLENVWRVADEFYIFNPYDDDDVFIGELFNDSVMVEDVSVYNNVYSDKRMCLYKVSR